MFLSKFKMLATLLSIPFIFAAQAPAMATERLTSDDLRAAKLELDRQSDAEAIAKAFRECLNDPALAAIITSAFETQIHSNRPLAFVNGYWAKPINLSVIYAERDLTNALFDLLADNPSASARLRDAVDAVDSCDQIDPGVGAGLVFIPQEVAMAEGMLDLAGLTESISGGAFLDDLQGIRDLGANDFWQGIITSIAGGIIAGGVLEGFGDSGCDCGGGSGGGDIPFRYTPNGDNDGDGIINRFDSDDDNDGVPDTEDAYPFDPSASITHCPPPGVCFSTMDPSMVEAPDALMGVVTQAWSDLVETGSLFAVETENVSGMVFSFPGFK